MSEAIALIGIDLGTTNSAVAWLDRRTLRGTQPKELRVLHVPQLVGFGRVDEHDTLPSFLFLDSPHEAPRDKDSYLSWEKPGDPVVGRFARERGLDQPHRLVSSAKSWLSHPGVDRTAAILPWGTHAKDHAADAGDAAGKGAAAELHKLSPVAAQARYLRHIREAWDATVAAEDRKRRFQDQDVVVAIPASFDEVARELTLQAALQAGFNPERLTLLEEPQAALYAWIWHQQHESALGLDRDATILVCDVGGGTTDFTLVAATRDGTQLHLQRVAVGEHLLLGGDNMDLALAYALEPTFLGRAPALDPAELAAERERLPLAQWNQLKLRARPLKEALIDKDAEATHKVALAGAGGSLIRGTRSSTVRAELVHRVVADGFFPLVELDADVRKRASALGLAEAGLPYAAEAAITRHLAAFLRAHAADSAHAVEASVPGGGTVRAIRPQFVLFNGGVFHSERLRRRVLDQLNRWFPAAPGEPPVAELPLSANSPTTAVGTEYRSERGRAIRRLDHAVCLGCVYYGAVRHGHGVAVESGSAHALYIGVATAAEVSGRGAAIAAGEPSAEAAKREVRAVCLIPRDFPEGGELELDAPSFELRANQPVSFPMFSSTARRDEPGEVVWLDPDSVRALPPIKTVLRTGKEKESKRIPVRLAARLNAIGTLDLYCRSDESVLDPRTGKPYSWKLAFNLRHLSDEAEPAQADPVTGQRIARPEDVAIHGTERLPRVPSADGGVPVVDESWQAAVPLLREAFTRPSPPERASGLVKALEATLGEGRRAWTADLCRFLADQLLELLPGREIGDVHEARWLNLAGYCLRPGFGFTGDALRVERAWGALERGPHFGNARQNQHEWWIFWRRAAAGLDKNRQLILFNATMNGAPNFLGLSLASANDQKRRKAERSPNLRDAGWAAECLRMAASLERVPKNRKQALGDVLLRRFAAKVAGDAEYWALARLASREPFHATADAMLAPVHVEGWVREILRKSPPPDARSAGVFFLVQAARRVGDRSRDVSDALRRDVLAHLERLGVAAETLRPLREHVPLQRAEADMMAGEVLPHGLVLRESGTA